MNVFKSIILAGVVLLLSFPAFAQGPGGPEGHGPHQRGPRGPQPEMLQELLDVSEQQMEALQPIFDATRTQLEALRDQEFEGREERREAMQSIMEAQKEKMSEILSAEQLEKLDALHEKRGKGPRAGAQRQQGGQAFRQKNKALHSALKAYHQEQVDPVMRAQRAKLESELSAEDRATITALRAKKAAHKAAMQEAKEKGERPGPPTEEQKAAHKADHETVKALLVKYETEIDALLEETKPQAEQWKKDIKAIHEEYRPADAPRRAQQGQRSSGDRKHKKGQGEKGEHQQQMKQQMHKAHFLLLDPYSTTTNNVLEESPFEMEAYPNPANGVANISYTVKEAGQVRIVLNSKSGNVSQVLFNGYQEAGEHTLEVNTSDLQPGTYFYTITDASRRRPVTKQLIITQ